MNFVYGYIQTKILENTVYYGFEICKNMAYDFIFNRNKNNEVLMNDPMWNKELKKKVFKKVIIDNEEDEENEEVVSNPETNKEEKKTKEIEIQTGESLYQST